MDESDLSRSLSAIVAETDNAIDETGKEIDETYRKAGRRVLGPLPSGKTIIEAEKQARLAIENLGITPSEQALKLRKARMVYAITKNGLFDLDSGTLYEGDNATDPLEERITIAGLVGREFPQSFIDTHIHLIPLFEGAQPAGNAGSPEFRLQQFPEIELFCPPKQREEALFSQTIITLGQWMEAEYRAWDKDGRKGSKPHLGQPARRASTLCGLFHGIAASSVSDYIQTIEDLTSASEPSSMGLASKVDDNPFLLLDYNGIPERGFLYRLMEQLLEDNQIEPQEEILLTCILKNYRNVPLEQQPDAIWADERRQQMRRIESELIYEGAFLREAYTMIHTFLSVRELTISDYLQLVTPHSMLGRGVFTDTNRSYEEAAKNLPALDQTSKPDLQRRMELFSFAIASLGKCYADVQLLKDVYAEDEARIMDGINVTRAYHRTWHAIPAKVLDDLLKPIAYLEIPDGSVDLRVEVADLDDNP